jgi:hypothetical protein
MDAGDWLLNLCVRRWLHANPNAEIEDFIRQRPIMQRGDQALMSDMRAILAPLYSDAPADLFEAMRSGSVRSGVEPLSVQAFYLFEKRLPEELRQAGAAFEPGMTRKSDVPAAFSGSLDDAFGTGPRGAGGQMTGRFVRVDLSLPDDVLHADLQRFLKAERRRLARLGGPQPYRESAGLKAKAHSLRTLATLRLLQFLDLDRWQRSEGLGLRFNTLRELADCDKDREDELQRYVARTQSQMKLHAWFARLDRSVSVTQRRRKCAG